MKVDICKYFWKCLDACDFDKYMAQGSSLGGSAETNVRQQYKKDVTEHKRMCKKLGIKNWECSLKEKQSAPPLK